jgi:hypothetical protein
MAGCAHGSNSDTGAAPQRADSAGVAQRADTAMQTPGDTTGQSARMPADSAQGQRTSPTPTNQATGADSMPADSAQGQRTSPAPTTGTYGDSAMGAPVKGDSALKGQATDTTATPPRQ